MTQPSMRAAPEAARQAARGVDGALLLAVSGGVDSMALLVAMAEVARARIAAVATFDHGTGPAATTAAAHVARVASGLGLRVVRGTMSFPEAAPDGLEAAWRRARHDFLRTAAAAHGARVITAHTEDDQVETVLMRVLRGSGARGLAGLAAPSAIVRPFLGVRRDALEAYVRAAGVTWVEDPGNRSRAHLRNRVRHDLLPALRSVQPEIDTSLLEIGRAAARWRREMEDVVDLAVRAQANVEGGLDVAREELRGYDRDSLAIMWGALAGRVGLALDGRGTLRLASFTMKSPDRGVMPLAGGWCLEARPGMYHLRRAVHRAAAPAPLPLSGTVDWGRFRFRAIAPGEGMAGVDPWTAWLPGDSVPRVRAWAAGDRLAPAAGHSRRRVARYLSEAGVHGGDRASWPVVVAGDAAGEVVWIPGVRRSDAATERSGRPVRAYVCERIAP